MNEKALRQRVFYSGIAMEIRKEVWKFLLGLYPASSTAAERADILKQKRLHYGRIKAQWTSISPEQAAKCVLPRQHHCENPFLLRLPLPTRF